MTVVRRVVWVCGCGCGCGCVLQMLLRALSCELARHVSPVGKTAKRHSISLHSEQLAVRSRADRARPSAVGVVSVSFHRHDRLSRRVQGQRTSSGMVQLNAALTVQWSAVLPASDIYAVCLRMLLRFTCPELFRCVTASFIAMIRSYLGPVP